MQIKLKSVSGKGFMGFRKKFHFNVEDFEGKTVQIDGLNNDDEKSQSNGAGKSTILESINWGWYGRLCRKNRYKDEVIHKGCSEAEIHTLFDTNDSQYRTVRTISKKKEQTLAIFKNDEEILRGSTVQYKQDELENILGMNFTAFQCSEMFGRDFMNFPDLKPSERAKILTDIRGLERYTQSSKKAVDLAKSFDVIVSNLTQKLYTEEGKLTSLRQSSYQKDIDRFEEERRIFIEEKKKEFEITEQGIKDKEQDIQQKLHDFQTQIGIKQNRLEVLSKTTNKVQLESEYFEAQKAVATLLADKAAINKEIMNIVNEIQKLTKRGVGECPFCYQAITGEYLRSKINQMGLRKMELEDRLETTKNLIKSVNDVITEKETELKYIQEKETEAKEIQRIIFALKDQILLTKQDRTLELKKRYLDNITTQIKSKQDEINPYVELDKKRKEQIKSIGVVIRNIKSEIDSNTTEKKYYEFWIDGFKKIRLMLFETMIEQLQSLIQEYLSKYSSELSIILSTERETRSGTIKDEFNISIVDSNGFEMSYEMYSGGEKQKARLSISRALAQFIKDDCGRDFNFIAFDEPNDNLDDVGKEVNFETFQELAEKEGKAVFCTDHDANFKDKFDHSILVVKEGGESFMSGGN